MASDKASLLKQRLRRGSDSFSFNALIEGVSTLDESASPAPPPESPITFVESIEPAAILYEPVVQPEISQEQPALLILESEPAPEAAIAADTDAYRLRWALQTLAQRFSREVTDFAAALSEYDTETAGLHLAQLNQALELLQPLDPAGDISRGLQVSGAPPDGKPWPSPAWSFVEFAESPLSGLLPADADESLVRNLLYRAWGMPVSTTGS